DNSKRQRPERNRGCDRRRARQELGTAYRFSRKRFRTATSEISSDPAHAPLEIVGHNKDNPEQLGEVGSKKRRSHPVTRLCGNSSGIRYSPPNQYCDTNDRRYPVSYSCYFLPGRLPVPTYRQYSLKKIYVNQQEKDNKKQKGHISGTHKQNVQERFTRPAHLNKN